MKIAISSKENHIDAPFASLLVESTYFLVVDLNTLQYKVILNNVKNDSLITDKSILQEFVNNKVEILVCGKCGSDLIRELYHVGIKVYHSREGSIRDIVKAFNEKKLISCPESNFIRNKTNYIPDYSYGPKDLIEVLAGCVSDKNEIVNI